MPKSIDVFKLTGMVICLLLVLPGLAHAVHLEGFMDIGTGGGYDDNLNNAASGNQKEGSGFATAWLLLGGSTGAGKGRLSLSAGYTGTYYFDFTDLTVNGFTIRSGFLYPLTDRALFSGGALWGARSYGDSDRDATVYGVSLALKVQGLPRLATRIRYEYTQNAAEEAVFSYDSNRLGLSGEVKVMEAAFLTFGYSLDFTERNLYQPAGGVIPPGAHGRRPSATFGLNQEVLKADSVAHIFSVDWDHTIYKELYTLVGYSYTYVQSDPGDYRDNLISGRIGYRF